MEQTAHRTASIGVLELRNYLLQPHTSQTFQQYFNTHFVEPMKELGGLTLGQFEVQGLDDRFVWLRGYPDMATRSRFLKDFYGKSAAWKTFGPGANELMINSDHVHLLKPIHLTSKTHGHPLFENPDHQLTAIDFYLSNGKRDKVVKLFEETYIPFLQSLLIDDISMWVSEMAENDFPRLPVFQDKDLVVLITQYQNEADFQTKQSALNSLPPDLKRSMQQLITSQSQLRLKNLTLAPAVPSADLEIPPVKFSAAGEWLITPSPSSSQDDFDFFEGHSTTRNRRLQSRLNNCQDWLEFDSHGVMNKFIGGKGNVDNYIAEFDGKPFEGMTVRLFDPKTRLWSIYWADSNEGKFGQPVVGSFEKRVGHFFCRDTFQGKNILVVFRWDARDPENPVWSQAFSDDLGKTWEWNWYMYMKKSKR